MRSFTFTYNGIECSGTHCLSTRGKEWIKVIFFEHSAVIVPTSLQTNENKRIWVQNIQNGESVWPHELIQSMGESIESIINNKFSEAEPNTKYQ
jgi:hypothetical protein